MKPNSNSAFGAFSMPREPELAQDSGQRMDTYNDDENSDYGSEDDAHRFGDLKNEDVL